MTPRSWRWLFLSVWVFAGIPVASVLCAETLARPADHSSVPPTSTSTVAELHIDGEIEPVLAEYIVRGIDEAAHEHASLILITINTPGGLDTAMRSIVQAILSSPVPVATYVYPTGSRAASAGFFILLSADRAARAPAP